MEFIDNDEVLKIGLTVPDLTIQVMAIFPSFYSHITIETDSDAEGDEPEAAQLSLSPSERMKRVERWVRNFMKRHDLSIRNATNIAQKVVQFVLIFIYYLDS